jgi:hypothetical protein
MNRNIKTIVYQAYVYKKVCAMYFHRFLLTKVFITVQNPNT